MEAESFRDAALVLAGHGSTLNAESADPVYRHADLLRERGEFAEVQECFWKLEPSFSGVLDQVVSRRVFVVPIFISEGYFTRQVLPRELGLSQGGQEDFPRIQEIGGRTVHYARPVGTHERMARVLARRATDILDRHPFPRRPADGEVSLFLAGHGTGEDSNSRRNVEDVAERLRREGRFADVQAVFMEEDPRIGDCYRMAPTPWVAMVPFFISDGLHSFEDIPVMLGEPQSRVSRRMEQGLPTWENPTRREGRTVWYTRSIGTDPGMTEVIRERVREIA